MRTVGRVVLFKGIIDSLDAFAEELAEGFQEAGADVLLINVNDLRTFEDAIFQTIEDYIYDEHTIVIFMNNIGMLMQDAYGGNYWNQSGVRCYDILADPPFFYHNAIVSDIEHVTFVCVDKEQADYMNRYYGQDSAYYKETGRIRKAMYMPLAGVSSHRKKWIPYEERPIDIIFTGNVRDWENIDTETDGFDENLKQLWDIVYHMILADTTLTIERAIYRCMEQYGLQFEDTHVHQLIQLFKRMDSVIRAQYREKVITTLTEAGLVVDVYGDGWERVKHTLVHPENLRIHSIVSYRESVEVLQQAKIALNVMPWFKEGFHDRIASAMLAGCVSVTDTCGYVRKHYQEDVDYIRYDLQQLEKLPPKVHYLLEHPKEAQAIAMSGQMRAAKQDTWANRVPFFCL